jgi:DNA-binding LacI/PurR family transcriptional regulator
MYEVFVSPTETDYSINSLLYPPYIFGGKGYAMVQSTSVQAVVVRHVKEIIKGLHRREEQRLPTIRQIAAATGVSHKTVSSVIARFRESGEITVHRARGIRLATSPAKTGCGESAIPAPIQLRWQRVESRMRQDILNGAFGFNRPLPSQKEMSAYYGVAHVTLRKALSSLVEKGVLVTARKSYSTPSPATPTSRDTILLFACGSESGHMIVAGARGQMHHRALEQECLAHRVQMQFISCFPAGGTYRFRERKGNTFTDAVDRERVLGFAVWQIGLPHGFVTELLAWLVRNRKPTALFCETAAPSQFWSGAGTAPWRSFSIETDYQVGRKTGRFLLEHGHRSVACFTDHGDLDWEQQRVDGLRQVFRDAGIESGIVAVNALDNPGFSRFSDAWNRTSLKRMLAELTARKGEAFRDAQLEDSAGELHWRIYAEHIFRLLRPAMLRMLENRSITAWVGINDVVARQCLFFLQESQIAVPGTLSVLGFDDTHEAAIGKLSSYDFNGASSMHAIVDYLLRPGPVRSGGRPGTVSAEGFVHQRATTGRARKTP